MLPRADIAGTRPVASLEAAKPTILTGDARQEVFQRLNRIALGTFLEAKIMSQLKDGSFVVKVADAAVRMNLPNGAQVGEKLELTLMATQPRLTFLLGGRPAPENTTSLSNAGRLVDRILHAAQDEAAPQAVVGKTPLANSPDIKPGQLASAMKDALAFSGVFYESHLEQWVNGNRPLLALMREPQAQNSDMQKLSAALRNATGGPPEDANLAQLNRLAENLKGKQEAAPVLMDLLRAVAQSLKQQAPSPAAAASAEAPLEEALPTAAAARTADAAPGARPESMGQESVRMIGLQLNTLEQQRLTWQGELWPGQKIEWEVSEDTPHSGDADVQERTWLSSVRFELPALGAVSATVRLTGNRVQIQLSTASEDAADLLRAHGGALSAALDAAGSPLDLLTVKRDEPA